MPTLYYGLSSAISAGVDVVETTADVGYMFLQYYRNTPDTELTRLRGAMITNGDGTFDIVTGIYHEDGTYTDAVEVVDLDDSNWETEVKAFQGFSYVITCTRAEYDDLVTAMGL